MIEGHGIKTLTRQNFPKRMMVLTAQSQTDRTAGGHTETWRCGHLIWTRLTATGTVIQTSGASTVDRVILWDNVDAFARQGVTFLWAWDLSWTARITGMLSALTRRGWRMDAFNFVPGASWMVWRKGRRTLKCVDARSVWPTSLEQMGAWFGQGRSPQPPHDAHELTWLAYARSDARILFEGVRHYLQWLHEEELGPLAVTGNAQAWAAFRTRHLTHNVLTHEDETLHELERAAMHTGRCEAYWHGSVLGDVVDEWDWSTAHNRIAMTENVPVYPVRPVEPSERWEDCLDRKEFALLAEVRVRTGIPVVPHHGDTGIVWPVGEFTTILWSPEIRAALDCGATVHVVRGWLYRAVPALAAWAGFVDENLALPDHVVPAWEKTILKRWSNTLIGRFAMRYPKWETLGRIESERLGLIPCWDLDSDNDGALLFVGKDVFLQSDWANPRDYAPCVTSYVMSVMRARLWTLMRQLPERAILYCDTDSILVSAQHRKLMTEISSQEWAEGLRLKRSWDQVTILGPRQIVTDGNARIAGLPKAAQQVAWDRWLGETTESMDLAMQSGSVEEVRSHARAWQITGTDRRRNGGPVGWTRPITVNE